MRGRRALQFHPDAVAEAEAARAWYEDRSHRAASAFLAELSHALECISRNPGAWQSGEHGTRRFVLSRFPFVVIYRVDDDRVLVVAVAHTRRKPGYWGDR